MRSGNWRSWERLGELLLVTGRIMNNIAAKEGAARREQSGGGSRDSFPNGGRGDPRRFVRDYFLSPLLLLLLPTHPRPLHKWTSRLNGRTGNCSDSSRPNKSHVSYFYFRPDARHAVIRRRQRRGSSGGGFGSAETRLRNNEGEYARDWGRVTSWRILHFWLFLTATDLICRYNHSIIVEWWAECEADRWAKYGAFIFLVVNW